MAVQLEVQAPVQAQARATKLGQKKRIKQLIQIAMIIARKKI